ncbi:hypothetical protein P152DRAFT_517272 [Eremomyces bilateralis CBS 781.70]|uniref:Rad21/Rec8-like protein N-terminal domain-containing protein n=1 Tax=Eremomyces bilateralis CBS 781.70 TaxID=1392243 RepID=A0A6G1FSE0_9PEZI|nr:uncharacterized protein P152DRAFT_517272 [Eremomyces bilateralis CBS 781.70]KAF1808775.1 hypothetical protein P152DRAFT_517272 [Eremomyces bilateralis CBS 781.70]
MFYIHEVLTDRKHGVATVWLLATLGSKSGVRKLNRRNIQEVNVPKACETIINPAAPMALRLQSSLLYGVSRACEKQCEYLHADTETIFRVMNQELHGTRRLDIDLEGEKTKSTAENLNLQDDPTFVPELVLQTFDIDLSDLPGFELSLAGDSQERNNFSPHTSQGSQGVPRLDLRSPIESSGIGGFQLPGAGDTEHVTLGFGDDEGFDPNVDFGFDAEGNLVDLSEHPTGTLTARGTPGPLVLGSDASARRRVEDEHAGAARQALLGDADKMDLDDLPALQYDDLSDDHPMPTTPQQPTESYEGSVEAVASLRPQQRAPRVIPMDHDTTLRNTTIKEWGLSYVPHMVEARDRRILQKANFQAKRNAEYWVAGVGLGGVGATMKEGSFGPLSMFFGDDLINAIVPASETPSTPTGTRKRSRTAFEEGETEEEVRRTRDEVEAAMGYDDEMVHAPEDEVEVAREAQPELEDISIMMPWNVTASVRGSSAHRLSSIARIASSIKGLTSLGTTGAHPDIRRRDTESPLVGRGTSLANQQIFQLGGTGFSSDFVGHDDFALGADELSEGEQERLQLQTESQVQRAALDRESDNFLTFIQAGVDAKQEIEDDVEHVTFEELLPPETTSRMIAAQGLFHVLALGSKNMVRAEQEEIFGDIQIRLIEG